MLLKQLACRAFSRAWAKTGMRIAAKMAMIAITTSSSIRVKPCRFFIGSFLSFPCDCRSPRVHGRNGEAARVSVEWRRAIDTLRRDKTFWRGSAAYHGGGA